jgi:hypothetical protein
MRLGGDEDGEPAEEPQESTASTECPVHEQPTESTEAGGSDPEPII